MSGHSKWATTHRQKELVDAKRGAIFTKLANNISFAAKKGGDPETNSVLRTAIEKARAANMPKDNVERAIKKGTGELGGASLEELYYEGLGSLGAQFIVKCVTDNKNRSASTVRHLFSKNGGSFGAVMWNFEQLGVFLISNEELEAKKINFDDFELELMEQEVRDIAREDEGITIYTEVKDFHGLIDFLEKKNIKTESAEIEYVAKEKLKVDNPEDVAKLEKFVAELEDNEDVSEYYTNADF